MRTITDDGELVRAEALAKTYLPKLIRLSKKLNKKPVRKSKEESVVPKKPKTKKSPKKKVTKTEDNYITLSELCGELNIEPSSARRKLRAHQDKLKPEGSWIWHKKKHKKLINEVKRLLK